MAYLCNRKAIETMDRYEGVTAGHYKQTRVTVESRSSARVSAITYVAGEDFVCTPGRPAAIYLHKIISGARHHLLPADYIEQIEALAAVCAAATCSQPSAASPQFTNVSS